MFLLSDPKSPDPVIPPDLHLVKPVVADANGNVPCFYCNTRVKRADAFVIGSQGYACPAHVAFDPSCPDNASLADTVIKRRLWPWVVGIAIVVVAGGAFMGWRYKVGTQRELEERYPEA